MTAPIEWLLIGGPAHGQWRLASSKPYAVSSGRADYAVQGLHWNGRDYGAATVRATVAIPRPFLYYPSRVLLPGWRVTITAYVEAGISAGAANPATGSVLPGCIVGAYRKVAVACRWCYGRPMDDMDVCSRSACIANVAAIQFLDVATGEDANWEGDRP